MWSNFGPLTTIGTASTYMKLNLNSLTKVDKVFIYFTFCCWTHFRFTRNVCTPITIIFFIIKHKSPCPHNWHVGIFLQHLTYVLHPSIFSCGTYTSYPFEPLKMAYVSKSTHNLYSCFTFKYISTIWLAEICIQC